MATRKSTATPRAEARIDVRKTYKLYIDGKFPRTESGRLMPVKNKQGDVLANVCKASKKDLRDSVVSNRKAQEAWAARSAYNKGQILYRIAETLESRRTQFEQQLVNQGRAQAAAISEVSAAIDLLVYYAGWTDKYIQVFSSVNPVESAHFNFSFPEPVGIAVVIAPHLPGLLGLVALTAPLIAGGNTCTVIASEHFPLTAIDFAEVLAASDVPGGVINVLTGKRDDLIATAGSHMDINAIAHVDLSAEQRKALELQAAGNVKRMIDFNGGELLSPYAILQAQEIKTTWHPVSF